MYPNDLTSSQYRRQLLKGSEEYIFYNLIGTYTITRILGNYGTTKGMAYFVEDKEHLILKIPVHIIQRGT
jgi:hypothetical protein